MLLFKLHHRVFNYESYKYVVTINYKNKTVDYNNDSYGCFHITALIIAEGAGGTEFFTSL